MITVPCLNVVPWLRNDTSVGTSNTRSDVCVSCLNSPFTDVLSLRFPGSLTIYSMSNWVNFYEYITSDDTRQGPRGANLSNPFENVKTSDSRCHLRADTSSPDVYAATYDKAFSLLTFLQSFPITTTNSPS